MADGDDSSSEWEEDEQYVFAELQGLLDSEYLKGCNTENSFVLGADTSQPVLKLNKYLFSGEYDDTIGTAVFFEEVEENGKKTLKYKCHTTRKLETVRCCLEQKEDNETSSKETNEEMESGSIEMETREDVV